MARRKLQKVFALLLTFSMLMSLLSVTALADEPDTDGPAAPTVEEHTHNDTNNGWFCQPITEAPLTCGKEEHTHSDDCYEWILTCEEEEREGHTHSIEAGCYELICDLEESEGHTHTDACYEDVLTCEDSSEDHVHDDNCYERQLTCGLEESEGHTHSIEAGCYKLVCTEEEDPGHTHTKDCYVQGDLTCTLEEHTHDADCYGEPEYSCIHVEYDNATKTLTFTGNGDFPEAQLDNGNWYSPACWYKSWYWNAKHVVVGEGITSLPTNAFYGSSIETVELPSTLTAIGDWAFGECSALQSVKTAGLEDIDATVALKGVTLGNFSFGLAQISSVYLEDCGNAENGYVFMECDGLSTATLKNCHFTQILFDYCQELTDVVVIGGNISNVFAWCDTIQTATITGCESIGSSAFDSCKGIKELTITGCGIIDAWAFSSCTGLTTLFLENCGEVKSNAFINCNALETLTVTGDTVIDSNAFQKCTALKTVNLNGPTEIASSAFANLTNLETLEIIGENVTIGTKAFEGCKKLTGPEGVLDLSNVAYIGTQAFDGCTSIQKLIVSEDARLGYSDIFPDVIEDWQDRVAGILDGKFKLEDATKIEEIGADGWTSSKTGSQNSTALYGDTQITKEAKWSNTDNTVADVQIKAYYTTDKQMDFVFVLDCTDSMTVFGSSADQYAKFYDMQSKLLDVSEELLTTPGYDCQVAFATYGEGQSSDSGWISDVAEAEEAVWEITDYESLTNISSGMREAQDLVRSNTGRNTAVILISDGTPNKSGTSFPSDQSYYGYTEAAAIKNAGAAIYGVLHSTNGRISANAEKVMTTICGENNYFTAYDTEGFSRAVNDAISVAYGDFVLVDTVNSAFELDESSIQASSGEVDVSTDRDGNAVITWTIRGMPFETHTLTFQEKLKAVDGVYPAGTFDTNAGVATLTPNGDATPVNDVETPQLPRTESTEEPEEPENPEEPGNPEKPENPEKPDNDPPIEWPDRDPDRDPDTDLPDEDTPTTDLPDQETPTTDVPDEETPTTEQPATELPDEDTPLAEVPETGDLSALWLALTALSGTGLAGVTFLGRKKRDEE